MPREPYQPFEDSVYRPVLHPIPVRGVAPDLPPENLGNDFLACAMNFVVRDGYVVRREGLRFGVPIFGNPAVDAAPLAFFEFAPVQGTADALLIAATRSAFYYYKYPDPSWTNITTTARTGTADNPIFFTSMLTASAGYRIYSVNGVNNPAHWSGATNTAFVVLTTAITGACIIAWRNHLLLGDTNVATGDGAVRTRVHWSALGDPKTWSGTASAGSIDLISANSTRVMNFVPMRTTLLAYKEEGVHALMYRGSPLYFTQTELNTVLTLVGRRCVAPIEDGSRHAVLTKDGVVIWDGRTVIPIGRDRVDRAMLSPLDWNLRQRAFVSYRPDTNEILVFVPRNPLTASGTWIYNLTYDSWWETNLVLSASYMSYLTFLRRTFVGGTYNIGKVYELFKGFDDETPSGIRPITAEMATGLFDYGAVEHKRLLKLGVFFDVFHNPNELITMSVRIHGQDSPIPFRVPRDLDALLEKDVTTGEGKEMPMVAAGLTRRWFGYSIGFDGGFQLRVKALVPYITERTDARKYQG